MIRRKPPCGLTPTFVVAGTAKHAVAILSSGFSGRTAGVRVPCEENSDIRLRDNQAESNAIFVVDEGHRCAKLPDVQAENSTVVRSAPGPYEGVRFPFALPGGTA